MSKVNYIKINYKKRYENSSYYDQTVTTTLSDSQIEALNKQIDKTIKFDIRFPFLDGHAPYNLKHIAKGVNYLNITTRKFIMYMIGESNNYRLKERNTVLVIK